MLFPTIVPLLLERVGLAVLVDLDCVVAGTESLEFPAVLVYVEVLDCLVVVPVPLFLVVSFVETVFDLLVPAAFLVYREVELVLPPLT